MLPFLWLVGWVREVGEGASGPRLVLVAYLLRSLAVAGYAPALDECAVCGTRAAAPPVAAGPGRESARDGGVTSTALRAFAFAIGAGGLVCRSCRAPGAATPAAQAIELMSALMRGDWAHADGSERRHQAECSGLVAAYLQWHLEHSIRSLRHVEHA